MRAPKPLWLIPMLILAASPAAARTPPMFFFQSGSARLTAQHEMLLDDAMRWLRTVGAETIYVDGFADRVGSVAANLRLSRQRAEAVRAGLIRRGFPADRITLRAFGESRPIVDTADGVPDENNRHSVILIRTMSPPGSQH